jgi:hypothetical protein
MYCIVSLNHSIISIEADYYRIKDKTQYSLLANAARVARPQSLLPAEDLVVNGTLDGSVLPENDLVDLERGFDWVGLVVDPFELLQGSALRLDTIPRVS